MRQNIVEFYNIKVATLLNFYRDLDQVTFLIDQ